MLLVRLLAIHHTIGFEIPGIIVAASGLGIGVLSLVFLAAPRRNRAARAALFLLWLRLAFGGISGYVDHGRRPALGTPCSPTRARVHLLRRSSSPCSASPASRDRVERAALETERGSAGLPVGVQVAARPWREELALTAMTAIERAVRQCSAIPEREHMLENGG